MQESQSREALFEVLGCYFARTLWVNQYEQAQEGVRDGKHRNLEEAYRAGLERYVRHVRLGHNPVGRGSYYDLIFNELYGQYNRYLAPGATPGQFTDVCCAHFCPKDSLEGIGTNDPRRRELIRSLLTKTLVKFVAWILSGQLAAAMRREDKAADQRTFRSWKDQYKAILQSEINYMCACIIAEGNGVRAEEMTTMTVPKDVLDKAQSTIRTLVEEKVTLTKERNELATLATELHNVVTRLTTEKQILENRLLSQSVKKAAAAQASAAAAQPLYAVPASIPAAVGPMITLAPAPAPTPSPAVALPQNPPQIPPQIAKETPAVPLGTGTRIEDVPEETTEEIVLDEEDFPDSTLVPDE